MYLIIHTRLIVTDNENFTVYHSIIQSGVFRNISIKLFLLDLCYLHMSRNVPYKRFPTKFRGYMLILIINHYVPLRKSFV